MTHDHDEARRLADQEIRLHELNRDGASGRIVPVSVKLARAYLNLSRKQEGMVMVPRSDVQAWIAALISDGEYQAAERLRAMLATAPQAKEDSDG